jgi:uncharacterized membrane protein YhaH (DUF805 family)
MKHKLNEYLETIFSLKGRFNREDFLLFGILLPIFIYGSFVLVKLYFNLHTYSFVNYTISFVVVYIIFASVIKRAKDAPSNSGLILFFIIILPPIGIIYLLFAESNNKKENFGIFFMFMGIVYGLLMIMFALMLSFLLMQEQTTDNMKKDINETTSKYLKTLNTNSLFNLEHKQLVKSAKENNNTELVIGLEGIKELNTNDKNKQLEAIQKIYKCSKEANNSLCNITLGAIEYGFYFANSSNQYTYYIDAKKTLKHESYTFPQQLLALLEIDYNYKDVSSGKIDQNIDYNGAKAIADYYKDLDNDIYKISAYTTLGHLAQLNAQTTQDLEEALSYYALANDLGYEKTFCYIADIYFKLNQTNKAKAFAQQGIQKDIDLCNYILEKYTKKE